MSNEMDEEHDLYETDADRLVWRAVRKLTQFENEDAAAADTLRQMVIDEVGDDLYSQAVLVDGLLQEEGIE